MPKVFSGTLNTNEWFNNLYNAYDCGLSAAGAGSRLSFCKEESGLNVETGVFFVDMKIDYINDGPITIMLECTKGKIL